MGIFYGIRIDEPRQSGSLVPITRSQLGQIRIRCLDHRLAIIPKRTEDGLLGRRQQPTRPYLIAPHIDSRWRTVEHLAAELEVLCLHLAQPTSIAMTSRAAL